MSPRVRTLDVAIVGGGLAGLAAARRLSNAGLRVRVLEARDRLGGRMFTEREASGQRLERGAQWVSKRHRRLRRICRALGIGLTVAVREGRDAWIRGATTGRRDAVDRLQLGILLGRAQLAGWGGVGRSRLDGMSAQAWLDRAVRSPTARNAARTAAESELCTSLELVSAFEVLRLLRSSGGVTALGRTEQLFFGTGASALIDGIAVGLDIEREWVVESIEQDAGGVTLTSASDEVRAHRVIVAIPPQLHHDIAPAAGWPADRADALGKIVRGDVVKVGLTYPTRWWAGRGFSGRISWDAGPFQHVLDASEDGAGHGRLVGFATADRAERLRARGTARGPAELHELAHSVFGMGEHPLTGFAQDWTAERFSLGGYASNRGMGGWRANRDVLADPVGRIHFAGTETARFHASYMEGALESAERVVREVHQSRKTTLPRTAPLLT